MAKKELIGGLIGFKLFIEMAKIEQIGGHIGFNVLILITKMKVELS